RVPGAISPPCAYSFSHLAPRVSFDTRVLPHAPESTVTSVLAISGSPSSDSRTALAVDWAVQRLSLDGYDVAHLAVRDLPAADLLAEPASSVPLQGAVVDVAAADGVIVATPVYKASYTGLLKAFLDLLPQAGLA